MDRHMLGLGDQPAVEVTDRGREIAARIEDLRIGGAQHCLAHLLDDRQEAMLNDGDGDGIDAVLHGSLQTRGGTECGAPAGRSEGPRECAGQRSSASGNWIRKTRSRLVSWIHCGKGGKRPTAATIRSTWRSMSG